MNQSTLAVSLRLAGAAFTLVLAMNCQALLVDCSSIPGLDRKLQRECVIADNYPFSFSPATTVAMDKAPPLLSMHAGFQLSSPRVASTVPDSLALMVFFAGLLGVILIRAKSCNSK